MGFCMPDQYVEVLTKGDVIQYAKTTGGYDKDHEAIEVLYITGDYKGCSGWVWDHQVQPVKCPLIVKTLYDGEL